MKFGIFTDNQLTDIIVNAMKKLYPFSLNDDISISTCKKTIYDIIIKGKSNVNYNLHMKQFILLNEMGYLKTNILVFLTDRLNNENEYEYQYKYQGLIGTVFTSFT